MIVGDIANNTLSESNNVEERARLMNQETCNFHTVSLASDHTHVMNLIYVWMARQSPINHR